MKINRHRLSNGLRIIHACDETLQMVYVNLLYGVGARNEQYEYTGIAHLFEHLMFEGTPEVPSFDEPLERAGGENNAYTNNDITNYYISLPKQNAELAFWMESDRMCNIDLTDESVSVQRQVVIEEFKQEHLNRPYGDVSLLLRPMAFKHHPYRWSTIGRKPSHIANVPVEVLRDFYSRYYAPDNAILAVVGNISFEQVVEWSEKWFGAIPAKGVGRPTLPVEPRQVRQRRKTVYRNVPQDALYMVFHMGGRCDSDFFPCDVISDVLSNGYSGRLMARLVRKKKIFTKIDAFVSDCIDPGLFSIYGRVAEGVSLEKAEEALWYELQLLQTKLVPKSEIEKVRNRFESEHIFRNLSGENLAGNLAVAEWRGSAESLFDEVASYRNVTPEEVRSATRELFRKGNSSVLYYRRKQK
ncbi:MAG: insulinase family protein [Bacteroidaceae bacterium]|nr:insulinase family protein [Bacteroidaceae bacterium]